MSRYYDTFSMKIRCFVERSGNRLIVIFCKRMKIGWYRCAPHSFFTQPKPFFWGGGLLVSLPEPWEKDKRQGFHKHLSKEMFWDSPKNPRPGAQSNLNTSSPYRQGTLQPDSNHSETYSLILGQENFRHALTQEITQSSPASWCLLGQLSHQPYFE